MSLACDWKKGETWWKRGPMSLGGGQKSRKHTARYVLVSLTSDSKDMKTIPSDSAETTENPLEKVA